MLLAMWSEGMQPPGLLECDEDVVCCVTGGGGGGYSPSSIAMVPQRQLLCLGLHCRGCLLQLPKLGQGCLF